jgi:hypothetical protein
MVDRLSALAAFLGAAIMLALIVSLSGGGLPAAPILDAVSIGTATMGLLVVVLAYARQRPGAWQQAGRSITVAGMTLVLAGDALQSVAVRDTTDAAVMWQLANVARDGIGNGLFFAGLLILGALMWRAHPKLAGLAVVNGVLGYLDMFFAARLGLPPHTNFLVLVVFFVALGIEWLRAPVRQTEGPLRQPAGV